MDFYRPRFSLMSAALMMLICSFGAAGYQHRARLTQLLAARRDIDRVASEAELQRICIRALCALDVERAKHRQLFNVIRRVSDGNWGLIERATVGGPASGLEVAIFHDGSGMVPGSERSLVILLRNQQFVDAILRMSSNRAESHEVVVEDADENGELDVVFRCRPGIWSEAEPFTITYAISAQGFERVRKDERQGPAYSDAWAPTEIHFR